MDWRGSPWQHAPFFWRPLLFPFMYYVQGLLWDHQPLFHALNVITHAMVCYALWNLLRSLTAAPQSAWAGTMVFAFYTLHYDVVFWSTAITSSIPAGFALLLCTLFVRFARGDSLRPLVPMAALAFFIACWYEQPATLVPALPCLYFAVCPLHQRWRTRIMRAFGAVAVMGFMLVGYITLMLVTVPGGRRGGAGSIVPLTELLPRLRFVSAQVSELGTSAFRQWTLGGIHVGWSALGTPLAITAVATVLLAGGFWVGWFVRSLPDRSTRPDACSRWWIALFALIWWVLCWLPFVPIRDQWVTPRCFYVPMLPVGILAALCVDAMLDGTRSGRARLFARFFLGAALALYAWMQTVSLVGWQVLYRDRTQADERQILDLKWRVPDPPRGSVFVPLEDTFVPTSSNDFLTDHKLLGWTGSLSTVILRVRHAYLRPDLYATRRDFWNPLPLTSLATDGFSYHVPFPGFEAPAGHARVPWDRSIPFCIDTTGRIVMVDRVIIEQPEGQDVIISPAPVRAARPGAFRNFIVTDRRGPAGGSPIVGWSRSSEPAVLETLESWKVARPALRLDRFGSLSILSVPVPPLTEPCRVALRWTVDSSQIDLACASRAEAKLTWSVELPDGSARELCRTQIVASAVKQEARWFPIEFDVPPQPAGARLVARLEDASSCSDLNIGVLVTPGHLLKGTRPSSAAPISP